MAMQSAALLSPLFPRFAHLLPSRLEVCTLRSGRRIGLLDYRTRPAKDLLLTRSSEDRRKNLDENIGSGEEVKIPVREELDWDLGWLPAFPHVLTASMANFLFGYHIGVMNGPIEVIAKELGFDGNPFLEGLVVSIFIVGAFIGCISSSSLSEKLGCRRTLQINAIPLIIGALLSAQAHSLDEMLWGRFIVGLGIGVNTVLVPIYISEVSPTRYRGSFGSLCQIGTCLGIIAALSLALPSESDPNWWRSLFLIASGPGLLLMLGMQFAAESPRWLCKVGRLADAESVICNLWGETDVENSMKEIIYVTGNIDDSKATWLDLLVEPHRKVAFIGGSLFILQQLSGINGVLYFSSLTFSDVGITSGSLASLYVGITNFAGALLALYLMDKQGRKKLLVGSYLGMAFSMFIIALAIVSPVEEHLSHTLSVVGSLAYIFSFAIGAGPVTGLVIPELSSAQMRSKIMAFSFSIHWSWIPLSNGRDSTSRHVHMVSISLTLESIITTALICNFLVGLFFLDLVEKFGVARVYGVFGAVSICSAIFATYFVVETKGRTLEEIEISLASDVQIKGR